MPTFDVFSLNPGPPPDPRRPLLAKLRRLSRLAEDTGCEELSVALDNVYLAATCGLLPGLCRVAGEFLLPRNPAGETANDKLLREYVESREAAPVVGVDVSKAAKWGEN